jgi:hypothetical protein
MTKAKIKSEGRYTLLDIARDGMFPWANSYWSVRNVVKLDIKGKNILKTIVVGKGTETKYHFKGENIIKFVKLVESGKVRL